VVRQLALSFGVFAEYLERTADSQEFIRRALTGHLKTGRLREEDMVVVIAGNFGDGPSFVEIGPVRLFLKEK